MKTAPTERTIILLVAAVQFVNIVDFMIVMPLGPDFAGALGIPTSHLGFIGGSYTAAASVTGLAGSFFLDRFNRRSALGVAMLGLVIGTALGGLATGLTSLLLARVIAGAFGGPATSIALSIITDTVPVERRGRAMGLVMSAFAAASVLGVPAGLKLARYGGWRAPFFSVGALGFLLAGLAVWLLPDLRGHLKPAGADAVKSTLAGLFRRPVVWLSYAMTMTAMMGMFALIPNLSAYIQNNLGYPRADIEALYLLGGVASFAVLQLAGRLVDRFGAAPVGAVGTLATAGIIWAGFVNVPPSLPIMVIFVGFMACSGFRNVAYNTLTSRVPRPEERARFMSIQSSVQHAAGAMGAIVSSKILGESPDGKLTHMDTLAHFTVSLVVLLPVLMFLVERRVKAPAETVAPETAHA